jgi:hypothetical protein
LAFADGRIIGAAAPMNRLLAILLVGSIGLSCSGPKPFLLQGDANSAQVGFSGDVEGAISVARTHCAQYERVPRFLDAEENVAFFDCVHP